MLPAPLSDGERICWFAQVQCKVCLGGVDVASQVLDTARPRETASLLEVHGGRTLAACIVRHPSCHSGQRRCYREHVPAACQEARTDMMFQVGDDRRVQISAANPAIDDTKGIDCHHGGIGGSATRPRPGVQIWTRPRLNSSALWSSLLAVSLGSDSGGNTHDLNWREHVALPRQIGSDPELPSELFRYRVGKGRRAQAARLPQPHQLIRTPLRMPQPRMVNDFPHLLISCWSRLRPSRLPSAARPGATSRPGRGH